MTDSVTTWSGWSVGTLIYNVDYGTDDVNITFNFTNDYSAPGKGFGYLTSAIAWDDNSSPPGFRPKLGDPVPDGYAVGYLHYYNLSGNWSGVSGNPNWFIITMTDRDVPSNAKTDRLQTNIKSSGDYRGFCYGPPQPGDRIPAGWPITAPADCKPFVVAGSPAIRLPGTLNFQSYGPTYLNRTRGKYNITLQLVTRVTVTRNCTVTTIGTSKICQSICLANPLSPNCAAVYDEYCLSGPAERFGTDTCVNYFIARRQAAGGVNPLIDKQGIAYCSSKYKSLQDFLDNAKGNDAKICGCYIRSSQYEDPDANLLYENFANDVLKVNKLPQFVGKTKCLFPGCAQSYIGYQGINGACDVPECVIVNNIENNGSITGDITIDSQCVTAAAGAQPTTTTWLIIAGVILLIIIIVIAVLAAVGVIGSKRKSKGNTNVSTKPYSGSVQV